MRRVCAGTYVVLPRVESRTGVTLWAQATNAHETESSSAPVRLALRGGR